MASYYGIPALLLILTSITVYLSKKGLSNSKGWNHTRIVNLVPPSCRTQLSDLSHLAPLLLPTDPFARKKLIKNYWILAATTTAKRLLKVAHPILLRRIIHLLSSPSSSSSSSPEAAGNKLPWLEIISFVLVRKALGSATDALHALTQRKARTAMTDRVELALYAKLLSLTAEFHETKQTGTLWKTVCSAGSTTVDFFSLLAFTQLPCVVDIVLNVIACWSVFGTGVGTAMVSLVVMYAVLSLKMLVAGGGEGKRVYEKAVKSSETSDNLSCDAILNWQTVAYFNRFGHEKERYERAVVEKRAGFEQWSQERRLQRSGRDAVAALGMAAVCLYGGYQIQNSGGRKGTGDFVLLFQFLTELFFPVEVLSRVPETVDRFLTDSRKFLEILRLEPGVKDREDAKEFVLDKGTIEFQGVCFGYEGRGGAEEKGEQNEESKKKEKGQGKNEEEEEKKYGDEKEGERDAVKDVSFRVEGGTMVAIVGETGGGKSTLFKLLCRAYDVRKGSIKIDGQDLRDVRLGSLREHLSVVPQSIGVFNASVLDNIRYANLDATRDQIEEACEAAALHKRILAFPNGYNEKVGEKGVKLSGGELQRLAIVRALLRPAQIVLFDEATSNLDAETEARIQEYLRKWYAGKTVVVVAHRLATIANADLIISFKGGRVVEAGRHDELLAKRGYFHLLWEKQRLAWDPPSTTPAGENGSKQVA